MKICIISPNVYRLPPEGYSGTENLISTSAVELARRGHQVAVVAPEGSNLGPGIEVIPVVYRESEEASWQKYRGRLKEFELIWDHTFGSWCYMDSIGVDPPLPIVKTFHTDPSIWESPPPVPHPCLVGISRDHASHLALRFGVACEVAYNGVDVDFYSPPPEDGKRSARLLALGRYTPEKGFLGAIQLAKRLRYPLDCYGDTEIVGGQEYVDRCRQECDGVIARWNPGVTRAKTVFLYRSYRALLHLHTWREPLGLVPLEAMSCGMPVIAMRRGGPAETVIDGVTGYLCDDERRAEEVLRSGCLKEIKPEACVARAKEFTVGKMVDRYLELFERVKNGHLW